VEWGKKKKVSKVFSGYYSYFALIKDIRAPIEQWDNDEVI
jgi:hypothetical protein